MKRILVIAHREELIFQAAAHAQSAGLDAGVEMGSLRENGETVVVSTVQTMNSRRKCERCRGEGCEGCENRGHYWRMEQFNPEDFGLVVVDEGHHATARTYRRLLKWFTRNPALRVLLVTATPKRADGAGLHNVCDSVAYEMDLRAAIDAGWLCPIRQRFVTVDGLDLSKVGTKMGGDLKDGELEKIMLGDDDEYMLHAVAKPTLDEANGQPILVFASGVLHAEALTSAFNAYPGVRAECVIGTTDRDERKRIIGRYKSGETRVLVGCGVFTEGFDAPGTVVVAVARPTKSESLYLQMIGRGTRPLPGLVDGPETSEERRNAIALSAKPACLVLDFVGNSGTHKIVSVADVLAGDDVDDADLEDAKAEARESDEPVDMEALLEKAKQAREEREAKKRAEAERRMTRHRAERADYTADDVDLFDAATFDAFSDYQPAAGGASQKQVNLLVKLGVDPNTATTYGRRQASKVIDDIKSKRCTTKQAATLKRFGYTTDGISMDEASRLIDRIAANGWKREPVAT